MFRTRKQILAFLREKCGYTGTDSRADVDAFIKSEEITIEGDFEAAWKTLNLKTVKITVSADAGEDVQVADESAPPEGEAVEDDMPPEDEAAAKAAKMPKPKAKATIGSQGKRLANAEYDLTGKSVRNTATAMARKAYAQKAAVGGTIYPDADQAEQACAFLRLSIAGLNNVDYAQKAADRDIIGKAGSTIVPQLGGVLVPTMYDPTVYYVSEMFGVAAKVLNVKPMNEAAQNFPRKTAIPAMTPVGESTALTTGDNEFDLVELRAKKWGVIFKNPSELFEDAAINVADQIAQSAAEAQLKAEDQAAFLGDGTSTYHGFRGLATALPTSAYVQGAGNSWGALDENDVSGDTLGALENADSSRICIVCSRQFYYQVLWRLARAKSGVTATEMINGVGKPSSNTAGQPNADFLGTPVYFSQVLPTASGSAVKSMYLGDFQAAGMLGRRKGLVLTTSDQRYFDTDEIATRAISRFGVNIHGDGKGSTYGPVVCLKTS